MKPLAPDALDLRGVREHVKLMHRDRKRLLPLVDKDIDVARLHAQWHVHPGASHRHGGDMVSVQYGEGRFSAHPSGWFTGKEAVLR